MESPDGSGAQRLDVLIFMPDERTQRLLVAQRQQEFLGAVAAQQPRIAEVRVQMHNMRDREGYTVRYGVAVVPTWILLCNGRELGRIVSEPRGSFAEEIRRILAASTQEQGRGEH